MIRCGFTTVLDCVFVVPLSRLVLLALPGPLST